MPTRVLETVLTGRDQLSPVLAKAAASAEAFEGRVEDSNTAAARSSTAAARVHQAAAQATADSATRIHAARGRFEAAGEDLGDAVGDGLTRGGDRSGGRLAQGIHQGLTRNSPLIAAAIGAALIAGAPVAIAAATTLFAGIGIVAAAQSERVKAAWRNTWGQISTGTQADAAAMQDALVSMASRVSAGFEQMRPQLRSIFADAAPLIDRFVGSLVQAGQNAMPGFVAAVDSAGPVMAGLGSLFESTGTGIGNFFQILSQHSDAAGSALEAIGRIIGSLLPILGQFLGTGAELASVVLPPLADVLEVVAGVLDKIAPILPGIAAGFAAFKIAGGIGDLIGGFADKLGDAAEEGGTFAAAQEQASTALDKVKDALPLVEVATAGLAVALSNVKEQQDKVTKGFEGLYASLRQGGAEAVNAQRLLDLAAESGGKWGSNFLGLGTDVAGAMETARAATERYWRSLPQLEQAQSKVAEWANTLNYRLKEYGEGSPQVEAAQRRLTYWTQAQARAQAEQNAQMADFMPSAEAAAAAQEDLANALRLQDAAGAAEALARYARETAEAADEQRKLEMATRGVTDAMAEQANQARSRVDAQFAYADAVDSTEDALAHLQDVQAHLNDTNEDTRTTLEDVDDATRAYSQSLADQAYQAGRVASSNLPATMDDTQKAILGAKGELDELNRLIASGVTLPPELEQYRQQLINITGQADGAMLAQAQLEAAVRELGFAVSSVPGEKRITITAPTDDLRAKLDDLGFAIVELPDGSIQVTAETEEAKGNLGNLSQLLVDLANQHPTPTVDLQRTAFDIGLSAANTALSAFGARVGRPTADMHSGPFDGILRRVNTDIVNLSRQHPTPTVSINDQATGRINSIQGAINAMVGKTIVVTTVHRLLGLPTQAGGGSVDAAAKAIGAASGRVVGPGTGTSDSVPAIGPGGAPWRLSNGEWVIQESAVRRLERQYGAATMATINSGRLPIAAAPAAMPGYGGGFGGGRGGPLRISVAAAPVAIYLDGKEWRGMARVEADAAVDHALGAITDTVHYAGG